MSSRCNDFTTKNTFFIYLVSVGIHWYDGPTDERARCLTQPKRKRTNQRKKKEWKKQDERETSTPGVQRCVHMLLSLLRMMQYCINHMEWCNDLTFRVIFSSFRLVTDRQTDKCVDASEKKVTSLYQSNFSISLTSIHKISFRTNKSCKCMAWNQLHEKRLTRDLSRRNKDLARKDCNWCKNRNCAPKLE